MPPPPPPPPPAAHGNDGSIQITTYAAQTTIVSLYDNANYSQNGDSH